MILQTATFEFLMDDVRVYSAHWYPNWSDNFSAMTESDKKRKFEVAIWRGGGYKASFYTDNRICEKKSKEFIVEYLKSLPPEVLPYNSKI